MRRMPRQIQISRLWSKYRIASSTRRISFKHRHLSSQKVRQRISVMKTNSLYSFRLSRELAFYFTSCLEVNKNTRIFENLWLTFWRYKWRSVFDVVQNFLSWVRVISKLIYLKKTLISIASYGFLWPKRWFFYIGFLFCIHKSFKISYSFLINIFLM